MEYIKLFSVISTYLTTIVAENQVCSKAAYYDRNPRLELKGPVIKRMRANDVLSCMNECVKTTGCLSVNSHNAGNIIFCELNSSNRYGIQVNLIETSFDKEYVEMVSTHWPEACFQKGGWYRSNSSAYKFVNERVNVHEARQRCDKMSAGADLVSFTDKDEELSFEEYLKALGLEGNVEFWIGFNDIAQEGTFVWFDGTKSSYTNWRSGEPNNANNEDCVFKSQSASGQWYDQKCWLTTYPFACKTQCI